MLGGFFRYKLFGLLSTHQSFQCLHPGEECWHRVIGTTHGSNRTYYIPVHQVLFLFIFVKNNLYSRLGFNNLEGILPIVLTYLIEGHGCTYILLLFVIGFNPSNVYALLYGDPTYDGISIFHIWVIFNCPKYSS